MKDSHSMQMQIRSCTVTAGALSAMIPPVIPMNNSYVSPKAQVIMHPIVSQSIAGESSYDPVVKCSRGYT